MYLWVTLRLFQAIDAHSGYDFPGWFNIFSHSGLVQITTISITWPLPTTSPPHSVGGITSSAPTTSTGHTRPN
ncbi:hypothetical protein FRC19_005385 [Serendipita sp. 401]|nr:hypothetical protein FRC19_005385 [Serendipita sp. 401]